MYCMCSIEYERPTDGSRYVYLPKMFIFNYHGKMASQLLLAAVCIIITWELFPAGFSTCFTMEIFISFVCCLLSPATNNNAFKAVLYYKGKDFVFIYLKKNAFTFFVFVGFFFWQGENIK